MSVNLNPEKALIFRIVHVANVPWILRHGMHCRNSPEQDPHYVDIGSASLIDKRSRHAVPIPPGGTLSDYVPFYFTPFSIMMYNIHTGYGGITRRANQDIVIFVSSLPRVRELGLPFVFTDQHANAAGTEYFSDLAQLPRVRLAAGSRARTSKPTTMTPASSSATKPRRWSIGMCRWPHSAGSVATATP